MHYKILYEQKKASDIIILEIEIKDGEDVETIIPAPLLVRLRETLECLKEGIRLRKLNTKV